MSNDTVDFIDQAIAWHLRRDDMADADWPVFVAWLEARPEHAGAYDRVARQDRLVAEALRTTDAHPPRAANDDEAGPRRWRWWAGGTAVAAALTATLLPLSSHPSAAPQVFATQDGEHRTVRLADGTQIAMNGGTTLRLSGGDGRSAELARGEVMIDVVHDDRHPFTLRAGDAVIRDVGTTFSVAQSGRVLSVAVASGTVEFEPTGAAVRLGAGEAATLDAAHGTVFRSKVQPDLIGSWRDGIFSFDGQPLAEVAAMLRRSYGLDLTMQGDLSERPFTGIVRMTGVADRDVAHLAGLIGATWRREGKGWILAEGARAAR